jgi:hypothetical protein
MSDTVIKVNNLSKLYRIGETIRHAITAFFIVNRNTDE